MQWIHIKLLVWTRLWVGCWHQMNNIKFLPSRTLLSRGGDKCPSYNHTNKRSITIVIENKNVILIELSWWGSLRQCLKRNPMDKRDKWTTENRKEGSACGNDTWNSPVKGRRKISPFREFWVTWSGSTGGSKQKWQVTWMLKRTFAMVLPLVAV